MMTRTYPDKRDDGVEWADSPHKEDKVRALRARAKERFPFGASFLQMRGDWSWMKQVFGLRGWKDAAGCCFKCMANKSTHPFTDASLLAAWRATLFTTASFLQMAMANGHYIPSVFDWPGFVMEFFHPDFMHCVCLGIVQMILGNIYFELFQSLGGVMTQPQAQLGHLLCCIRLAAKNLGVQPPIHGLTFSMIKRDGKSPKLRLKAAEGRYMVPITLRLLELFFPSATNHDNLRFECLSALNLVYLEMKNWNPNSPRTVATEGRRHVMLYAELSKEWLATNETRSWFGWKYIPKHHLSIHCFEEQVARYGNPAESWNYFDESEIGDAVKLAESGLHPRTLRKALLQKYRTSNID